MTFNINDGDSNLCVSWSLDGLSCMAVGDLGRNPDFTKLQSAFSDLREIPFCVVYNKLYGCDMCEAGRAFNGNECAPCDSRGESESNCEYPWKKILSNSLWSGTGNHRLSGSHHVYNSCIRYKNTRSWDDCLKARSNHQYPRHLSPGRNASNRGIW